jgi:hypothetical protein
VRRAMPRQAVALPVFERLRSLFRCHLSPSIHWSVCVHRTVAVGALLESRLLAEFERRRLKPALQLPLRWSTGFSRIEPAPAEAGIGAGRLPQSSTWLHLPRFFELDYSQAAAKPSTPSAATSWDHRRLSFRRSDMVLQRGGTPSSGTKRHTQPGGGSLESYATMHGFSFPKLQ